MGAPHPSDFDAQAGENPFTPPRETWRSLLVPALAALALAVLLYRLYDASLQQPQAAKRAPPPPAQPPISRPVATPAAAAPPQANHRGGPAERAVAKCVRQGTTLYTDGPCPGDAHASEIRVDPDLNRADRLIVPPTVAVKQDVTTADPPPERARAEHDAREAVRKQQCADINARIDANDAMARQPLHFTMQDWLREEKRKLREEWARLRC